MIVYPLKADYMYTSLLNLSETSLVLCDQIAFSMFITLWLQYRKYIQYINMARWL